MPANNRKREVYLWQGRYQSMGWLFNAYSTAGGDRPWKEMPWAIDNGAFICFQSGEKFDGEKFISGMDRLMNLAHNHPPLWVVVPDVVGDSIATLASWEIWSEKLAAYKVPLAFAAQDGHVPRDVPEAADVVFIGGSTEWKRKSIVPFCATHKRVHVGRINTERWLRYCHEAGAESCDGTGWFRGDANQLAGLERYLAWQSGGCRCDEFDLFAQPPAGSP